MPPENIYPAPIGRDHFLNEDIYQRPVFAVKTIVIDPGHGVRIPALQSVSGMKEKDLNLKVAKYLEEELSRRGFRVFLTRSCDIFLELQERVEVARNVMLISL